MTKNKTFIELFFPNFLLENYVSLFCITLVRPTQSFSVPEIHDEGQAVPVCLPPSQSDSFGDFSVEATGKDSSSLSGILSYKCVKMI